MRTYTMRFRCDDNGEKDMWEEIVRQESRGASVRLAWNTGFSYMVVFEYES